MKPRKRILVTIAIGFVLIVGFYFISGSISKSTGLAVSGNSAYIDESFIECLKKQDIRLYINTGNSEAELQKTGLTQYLEAVKIHNCYLDQKACQDLLIESTQWLISGNKVQISGLDDLEKYSGCKLSV